MASLSSTATAQTTAYGIPIRNLWHMLLYAWNESPHSPIWRMVSVERAPSLDALLATLLIKLVQQRLRIGLGRSYMAEQQTLRGIRGRVQFTKSLKQRTFERGQVLCEFENYSTNAPKNQIVRSTLLHLAQVGEFGPDRKQAEELRHGLRKLVQTLDGIDLIQLTADFIRRQQAKRQDHDYRVMLAICDLILQRKMPTEQAGHRYVSQLERDRFVLHRLYERFVANFYRHHLRQWHVSSQSVLAWPDKSSNQYLPTMKPDVVLKEESSGQIIILDTKFTAKSLIENRWGKEMFDPSHLYQIYTYLGTQAHLSDQHRRATGILLYPAITEELSEAVELQSHRIRVECVNLAASWQHIEQRLIDVIMGHVHDNANTFL
jgi:5-methylcytosine-specific restriction enzyme subunit McrC